MKTTLDIDDDVMEAAKELSEQSEITIDEVISDLLRKALSSCSKLGSKLATDPATLNGFEVMPADGRKVTAGFVRNLIESV